MTDWDHQYAIGETPWERGSPAPPLTAWLTAHQFHGTVLVPGCGTGHDMLAAAQHGAEQVIGLDISPRAVALAEQRLASTPSATVRCADLFTECHGPLRSTCDWIIEHTCLSALPPDLRPSYVAALVASLRPGGRIFAIFFINPWDPDEDQTQGPPYAVSKAQLEEFYGPYFTLEKEWQPDVAYPGREGRELVRILQLR